MCKEFLRSKSTALNPSPAGLEAVINSFRPVAAAKRLTLFSFTAARRTGEGGEAADLRERVVASTGLVFVLKGK